MSDGDSATPGRRDPSFDRRNQWLTRSSRPSLGAAPWERNGKTDNDDAETSGHHTDGVTVADLIARVSGDQAVPPQLKRPAEPSPPPAPPTEVIDAVREPDYPDAPVGDPDTEIIPALKDETSDLPDLTLLRRRGRVPPSHVGSVRTTRSPEPRRRRRGTVFAGRAAAALLAVLALVLTGGAWQWQSMKNNMLNRISALDQDSRDIIDPNAQFGDENFLIVGVDSRTGANLEMGAGTPEDAAGARSDTVMLVNIPANRERVVAVSFPRDLEIEPMQCEPWDPETGEYGPITDPESPMYGMEEVYTEYKLNSAYAVGGPKCLVKVVQKLSGLSVNRFMAVDFAGFSKMVDALGGVEVCTTTPLEDYELGTVLPNAGRQMIDGHTALQYVRARQVTTETNGDYGRIKRQQLFLSSLLRSLISKEVFFSLSKLNNVVNMFIGDSYVDNINTKELVTLGQSLQNIAAGRITFLTVPTTGYMDEWGNEQLREDDTRAIFDAIINDDPLPEEKNADNSPVPGAPELPEPSETTLTQTPETETETPTQDAEPSSELVDAVTTNPQDITVQVSNSTGEDGLASTAATELQAHGFNVTTPDDYPGPLNSTTVFFSAGNEQAAATVASSFANPTIERVTGMGDTVQVVLGSDFYTVNAPSPSGSPVQVHVVHGTSSSAPTQLPEDLAVTNAADTTCE
ncbi:LCP family protein [Mycobacterium deserti]|uniref:LCP family protein n=1 Tax=Mycobacterium deserti TaxID=2978347 RepID=A0ABT2M6U2_9MYCO|nr:LCP family protein [Mycobacterium deserti]MCT7657656.1 LCP family protein [Mycobacterium deserti]